MKKSFNPLVLIPLCLALSGVASAGLKEGVSAYESGDYATALAELRPLADNGDAEAQFTLSWMYRAGKGVPLNMSEAAGLLQKAANQGHPEAQVELSSLMFFGIGIPPDVMEGVSLLERAAAQGLASAQEKLGVIYMEGIYAPSVPRNFDVGMRLLQHAVDQGYAPAMHSLGRYYYYGEMDFIKAAEMFQQAAKKGYADSMLLLGLMYSEGQWFARDDKKAYMWLQLAMDNGNKNAAILRQEVSEVLSALDRDEADAMAVACRNQQYEDC